MSVLVGEHFACIRIKGRANFSSSIDFKTLLNELQQKGYAFFVLDLSECVLMDSTFLGVLAGFGLKMNSTPNHQGGPGIELFNPSPRITELLESLGVLHLFQIAPGPLNLPAQTESCPAAPSNPTKADITRACLEAHQTLMTLNPDNVSRFKDLAAFLAQDLKKLKPA